MNKKIRFLQGNEACVEAALYAGLQFYAGYPITPSTEIAEHVAYRLPQQGANSSKWKTKLLRFAPLSARP